MTRSAGPPPAADGGGTRAVHLVMFDIDGTLIESYDFDSQCFQAAVEEVLGVSVDTDWGSYVHVTDSGIVRQIVDGLDLRQDHESILAAIKDRFVHRISLHLAEHGLAPVAGAADFLSHLRRRPDVAVAMATGGWLETAGLKLAAAGIEVAGIPLASASDHYDRIEIMRVAELRAGGQPYASKVYFGDGDWDLRAATRLGFDFVLVGDRFEHRPSIPDFIGDRALSLIGLQ